MKLFRAMERPAKRQKLSSSRPGPSPTLHIPPQAELSCTHADARTEGSGGRLLVLAPTLNQHDDHDDHDNLRRRHVTDGSSSHGRHQPPSPQSAAPIVPRAPDTTVVATAVDVNVQVGNTTVANTLVLQATDATVVSFTSLGVLTVLAQTTTSSSDTLGTTSSGSLLTSAPSVATGASAITNSLSSSTGPTPSLPPAYNSSATSTSDITTTVTSTSTLNVSFVNGTLVTVANTADTNVPNLPASLTSTADSSSNSTGRSAVTSKSSAASNLTPVRTTDAAGNGASAAPLPGGAGAAGSGSPTTEVSSPTSSSSSSHGGSGLGPATPAVVGGVVGGVAGMAFLLLILLALLRWYRKRLQSRGQLPEQIAARSATGGDPSAANQMSSPSSQSPFAAAMLSSTRRWRPQSLATTATAVTNDSTTADPARGFQRIAGRKIAPVIGNDADQYGGNYGAFEKDFPAGRLTRAGPSAAQAGTVNDEEKDLASSSFYRDSRGFYGGKGDLLPSSPPPPTSPTSPTLLAPSMGHAHGSTRDLAQTDSVGDDPGGDTQQEYAVIRPSPARTPVTSSPAQSLLRVPVQQGPTMDPGAPPTPALPAHLASRRQDSVGRSLPSQDGSKGSRFTESV